ncbi:hypothetical protein HPP92_008577 [Vanilla planifolia]|uniref:Uncharacterized protein n=1 Tax=Vanilla planifolia TaxID=51239 RepID=A0A835R6C5_VANPL|nr:hypothetical protein HPP92_008577 [Vanilla planifolia]
MGMSEGIETPKGVAADEEPAPRSGIKGWDLVAHVERIFRLRSEDYEKKLQHLSKEEAAVQSRMKMRAFIGKGRGRGTSSCSRPLLRVVLEDSYRLHPQLPAFKSEEVNSKSTQAMAKFKEKL